MFFSLEGVLVSATLR